MAKLRTLLAAALLTVPVLTLSMNVTAGDAQSGPRLEATTAATGEAPLARAGRGDGNGA